MSMSSPRFFCSRLVFALGFVPGDTSKLSSFQALKPSTRRKRSRVETYQRTSNSLFSNHLRSWDSIVVMG